MKKHQKLEIPSIDVLRRTDFNFFLTQEYREKLYTRKKVYMILKRILDFALAVISFVIASPFLLAIIIAIKLDSPGPSVFKQKRAGLNGDLFMMYKFRTMYRDAKPEEYAPTMPGDARITRIGRFLRRTSLDELPQLLNVIFGQMSLVGPRPEMKFIVDTYTPLQKARMLVKPGLTGLWQIYGRKDLPLHKNVEYDLFYIQNCSLRLDFMIILRTFGVVFNGKGAY